MKFNKIKLVIAMVALTSGLSLIASVPAEARRTSILHHEHHNGSEGVDNPVVIRCLPRGVVPTRDNPLPRCPA